MRIRMPNTIDTIGAITPAPSTCHMAYSSFLSDRHPPRSHSFDAVETAINAITFLIERF
jgi:hypothetical protein